MEDTSVFVSRNLGDFLSEASDKLEEDERKNFRYICLSSNMGVEELAGKFEDKFRVTQQGDFYHLNTSYTKLNAEFEVNLYLYEPVEGFPLFLTLNSSEDFQRSNASSVIRSTEGVHNLWMPPSTFDSLKEDVLEIEGSKLTAFVGKKFGSEGRFEEERRPDVENRTGRYEAGDAVRTLDERRKEYGIQPTKLDFEIPPNGELRMTHLGQFVLFGGSPKYVYENVVTSALEKVEEMNKTVQSSDLDIVEENGVERISEKTLEIQVENSLDYDDGEDLVNEMKSEEFYPHNVDMRDGSLLFNAEIVDEKNGGVMSVSTDGETFSILPKFESEFDPLMRFYQFIVENVDSNARIE